MLDYIILGVLLNQALSGYDIRKQIEQGVGMFYKASYGSIYPILAKLAKAGALTCEEIPEGKRIRKQYTITAKGKEQFFSWLQDYDAKGTTMETFMAKVFFFDYLPKEQVADYIERYQQELALYRDQLLQEREKYLDLPNPENFYYKLSTLFFGICKLQGIIDWCETVKEGTSLDALIVKKEER